MERCGVSSFCETHSAIWAEIYSSFDTRLSSCARESSNLNYLLNPHVSKWKKKRNGWRERRKNSQGGEKRKRKKSRERGRERRLLLVNESALATCESWPIPVRFFRCPGDKRSSYVRMHFSLDFRSGAARFARLGEMNLLRRFMRGISILRRWPRLRRAQAGIGAAPRCIVDAPAKQLRDKKEPTDRPTVGRRKSALVAPLLSIHAAVPSFTRLDKGWIFYPATMMARSSPPSCTRGTSIDFQAEIFTYSWANWANFHCNFLSLSLSLSLSLPLCRKVENWSRWYCV